MAPDTSMNPAILRSAAGAARALGTNLDRPNDAMADACKEAGTALSGFAVGGALAGIAPAWNGQIHFISGGYVGAAKALEDNAAAQERADAERQAALTAKPEHAADGRGWI
jgi:hypothetical protein